MQEAHFPELTRIGGIDCSTPKCYANARCSGRIVWDRLGVQLEVVCPDCGEESLVWTPATQRLGDALQEKTLEAQVALVHDFWRC